MYLESSLIKFKEKGCVGIMTIRNGKIGPILGSITDLDGDKEEEHPSFGFTSERFGVTLQRPKRRMVLFYCVLKA